MAGATRSFEHPGVARNIKHTLLEPLLVPTDVFVDFHTGDDTSWGPGSGAKATTTSLSDSVQRGLELLDPVRTYIRSDSSCSNHAVSSTPCCRGFRESMRCLGGPNVSGCIGGRAGARAGLLKAAGGRLRGRDVQTGLNVGINGYLQYAWVGLLLRSALQYEESHALQYSWLLRTRPDIVFAAPLPPEPRLTSHFGDHQLITTPKSGRTCPTCGHVFDGVWLMPRRIAQGYLSRLNECFAKVRGSVNAIYPPEDYSFACVQELGIPFSCAPIAAIYVRGGDCDAAGSACSLHGAWTSMLST